MPTTTSDVLDAVADVGHVRGGAANLQPFWTGIATRALAEGNRDVLSTLIAFGLTGAQIQTWAGFDAAVLQQSLFWALGEGGALLPAPVNQQEVKDLDLREWLKTAVLRDSAGNLLLPDPSLLAGHGLVADSWQDVKANDPQQRMGFVDSSGRFRPW